MDNNSNKNKINLCFLWAFSPRTCNLHFIRYQLSKFEAPAYYYFLDILITMLHTDPLKGA